jgi:hypothetical protein
MVLSWHVTAYRFLAIPQRFPICASVGLPVRWTCRSLRRWIWGSVSLKYGRLTATAACFLASKSASVGGPDDALRKCQ